jgi:hypothetical protein
MQKKSLFYFAIFAAAIFLSGCATRFSIVKDNPSSPKLSGYKSIYVGWLDFNEDEWKTYGYDSKDLWLTEIKRHNVKGLQEYFKAELPDKTVFGALSKTEIYSGKGDLFIKFKLINLEAKTGAFKDASLTVDAEFIDGKSGKTLYTASIVTSSFAPFPRNWKGNSFDGRLDNEIFNLSWGIAEKLK